MWHPSELIGIKLFKGDIKHVIYMSFKDPPDILHFILSPLSEYTLQILRAVLDIHLSLVL